MIDLQGYTFPVKKKKMNSLIRIYLKGICLITEGECLEECGKD